MNDYLSKPFNQSQMQAILKSWLGSEGETDNHAQPENTRQPQVTELEHAPNLAPLSLSPLDPDKLQELLGLDEDGRFFGRLVEAYLTKSATDLEQLRQGVAEACANQIREAAHSLKSSSANVGGLILSRLCQEIEMAGHKGELSNTQELLEQLELHYRELSDELIRQSRIDATHDSISL
ncbi:Hpt domain-containing protein [Dongshaea marina]|uniref:Hpt domain-containing protein n=1 Tax=Dongshaea marina TaxID=2047966 RepID=UPI000D3E5CC7|nr:Hpt domain-containing protein [Dongshaea marina]